MSQILNYASPQLNRWRGETLARWLARAYYLVGGVIVPLVAWGAAFTSAAPAADWQNGHVSAYLAFLVHGKVAYPLFPFLLFPMVCMSLLLVRRDVCAEWWWVRAGIYSALPLAAAFGVILALAGGDDNAEVTFFTVAGSIAAVVAASLAIGGWWLTRLFGWRLLLATAAGGAFLLALVVTVAAILFVRGTFARPPDLIGLLIFAPFLFLGAAPAIVAITYAAMAFYLLRRRRDYPPRLGSASLFWTLWTPLQATAWAAAVVNALVEYSKLPTAPPSRCFVASAAARGHHRFVGAQILVGSDGQPLPVNEQLRTLKGFEIALQTLMPRPHAAARRLYNRFGPPLARRLTQPLLADAAYVALKPFEVLARAALSALGARRHAAALYRHEPLTAASPPPWPERSSSPPPP